MFPAVSSPVLYSRLLCCLVPVASCTDADMQDRRGPLQPLTSLNATQLVQWL